MESRSCLAGVEVPVVGSDLTKWVQLTIPTSSSTSISAAAAAPLDIAKDAASFSIFGDPATYLIWRIGRNEPHMLELLELLANQESPQIGLRIFFPDKLFPYALICKDENSSALRNLYILYVVTISGVAYLVRLKSPSSYVSSYLSPSTDFVEYNTQHYPQCGAVAAVSAIAGCLLVGRTDGSVGCFQLGMLDPNAPGFLHELRDDMGLNRLWSIMSRNRIVAPVQDLVISELYGVKLLFVLHSDGILRVWNLLNCCKVFSHAMPISVQEGTVFSRLWVGEVSNHSSTIPLALQHKHTPEVSMEMISIYRLCYIGGDRMMLSLEPSVQNISLGKGELIDVRLMSNKLWILKEDGLLMQELFSDNMKEGTVHCYTSQETLVADLLFEHAEHSSDDLLQLALAVSPSKDRVAAFVSSIFLRRLFLPGVYLNTVLRTTFREYNKHFSDSEFDSLTVGRLKNEVLSLIEHEGGSDSPLRILRSWKTFCTRYFHNWCKNNAASALLIDSFSGAVGLIRKSTLSLCRDLEDVEQLIFGSLYEGNIRNPGMTLSMDDHEREILFEMLRCISYLNQQLGKASPAIIYESLLSTPITSTEEVIPVLLKILETGRGSSMAALDISELGADVAWEREESNHRNIRKFSMDIFFSLKTLCERATSWAKVLDVVQSFLRFLVPQKISQNLNSEVPFSVNTAIAVQGTSQVAKVMFESALDVLMLLSYMVKISGQINMSCDDVSRVKLELIPMIQEIVAEWHIVYFLGTSPSESPVIDDFSSQLSSLQLDSHIDKGSWHEKLGKCEYTLAFIILLSMQSSSEHKSYLSFGHLPGPCSITSFIQEFSSWIIWGRTGEESSVFFKSSIEVALVLLRHGQYDAAEYLLTFVEAYSHKEKISESLQGESGDWSVLLHLLGCCLLAQTQRELHGTMKEKRVHDAVCCFFRAASMQGARLALQRLPSEAGFPHLGLAYCASDSAWKLHYYQWIMQKFEQYNMSEAACQFAHAALEQVDEALALEDSSSRANLPDESAISVKGRLWANVFKFALDLNHYYDAYCAIITNPDEESKNICLRRFIIVLYERGAIKILCDGQLPFIGLTEKVERELALKAARSDFSAKPNPYKLLYAFEMRRHSWRRAANYMYLYSAHLRSEAALKYHQHRSLVLQERLNGLSAAINALQLIHPAHAWLDPLYDEISLNKEQYPSKKPRLTIDEQPFSAPANGAQQMPGSCMDVQKLENEFVLTSAEYLLSLTNIKWTFTGIEKPMPDLLDLLIESNLYDMTFTVILQFWKGSGLKRELERAFSAMSLKCCPSHPASSLAGGFHSTHLLLASSQEEMAVHRTLDVGKSDQQSMASSQWERLESYLEKYKGFHPRLPIIVAETLLSTDPQIELPLWLVQMFKGVRRESGWKMTGDESNAASLFCLYVKYGRYTEATNLLLEYIESFASMRPMDIVNRKRPCAVWFPYTIIERLWCQLEESIKLGHKIDQCEKLKQLLQRALLNHLSLLKMDSEDVQSK